MNAGSSPTGDSSPATGEKTRRRAGAGVTPERTGPSVCHVVHDQGSDEVHFDRDTAERLLGGDGFFWLDIDQPSAGDFQILRDVFKFHPLAIEDSEQFDQRAKLDEYDDFVFIVVYGAAPDDDRLVEVHCFYSARFLITVHRDGLRVHSTARLPLLTSTHPRGRHRSVTSGFRNRSVTHLGHVRKSLAPGAEEVLRVCASAHLLGPYPQDVIEP